MKLWSKTPVPKDAPKAPRFPGVHAALDGSSAVTAMETEASDAAAGHPTVSTAAMIAGWNGAVTQGAPNAFGRRLLAFEPENAVAAAAMIAGVSMAGLRAALFTDGQGLTSMHEALHAAAGQRLTYVLNLAASSVAKQARSGHAGHESYHAAGGSGFFQLFAKDAQEAADLNLIAHKIAEMALTPGLLALDAFLTTHVIENLRLPERAFIGEYLGDPADRIDTPTKAQRAVFGHTRRRIPEMFDLDYASSRGGTQNPDSFAQGVAAQRPFYLDQIAEIADAAFAEYENLTGRRYARATGHRLEDAEWVIVGQGSVVGTAESVANHLRAEDGLKIGVLNLTMLRPFPADLVTALLADRKGVLVLERADQPLAADAPLLCEIRAAMSKGLENGRHAASHAGLAVLHSGDVPEFYSACFGLGGRDLQAGDLVAAVRNMLPRGALRRQFYLGLDFVRPETRLPKLQIWQESLIEHYPHLATLALRGVEDVNLLPPDSLAVRIHSQGGWDVSSLCRDLARVSADRLQLHVKASLPRGSEKKGQPVVCSVVLSPEPVRLNSEPLSVDVVLSPDPSVFRHADPLSGLVEGGLLIVQHALSPSAFWKTLDAQARQVILDRRIRVCVLDALAIGRTEASGALGRRRMQNAAFVGAFFGLSPLLKHESKTPHELFTDLSDPLTAGVLNADSHHWIRAVRRGFDEAKVATPDGEGGGETGFVPQMPVLIESPKAEPGPAHEGRFWEQVCSVRHLGQDGVADPFAALGVIPAATAAARDMSRVRLQVPEFNGLKCTGCGECWAQCPDSAIPGLVTSVEDVLAAAVGAAAMEAPLERVRALVRNWAKETSGLMRKEATLAPAPAFALAYDSLASKMNWDADRRAATDAEFHRVQFRLAEFPLARTRAYFDAFEGKARGAGGLLSVTVNPDACKGCTVCVEVCPEGALTTVAHDEGRLRRLRENWALWNRLPDTDARFAHQDEASDGRAILASLLLQKGAHRSMVGGDGACQGCGQKTAVHLIVSAIHAQMAPLVIKHVAVLDRLIEGLEGKARELLASGADLHAAAKSKGAMSVPIDEPRRARLALCSKAADALRDLRWRYAEGPSGMGRASLGMANDAGCSSVWGSTYPYNPYPFPWVSHTATDAPSVALGLFEAHMRKMADGFVAIRRATAVLDGAYDATRDEASFASFGWRDFTDDEFALCPPIVAMGGDGAMIDGGLQSLSRLLSSGKPVRVVVLDTQGHSDSGGQPSTGTFAPSRRGSTEARKELALLAMAHREVFVHQSSQASPAHLMGGVLRGLKQRRPAVFNIYTPCTLEHGLAEGGSPRAARWALESRAFPFLTYDPEGGPAMADRLSLDGNPAAASDWPVYTLRHLDEAGAQQSMEVPLTIADWAATEERFQSHFTELTADKNAEAVPFDRIVAMPASERVGRTPFIHAVAPDRRLRRLEVSAEMVALAEERRQFWSQLRQFAGLEVSGVARTTVASAIEAQFDAKVAALRQEHDAIIAKLKRSYPQQIARRLAEGLMKHGGGAALSELLSTLPSASPSSTKAGAAAPTAVPVVAPQAGIASPPAAPVVAPVASAPIPAPAPAAETAPDDGPITLEAYIDSARCTTCNECINLNKRMFAYNAAKQAEIKDASAGSFQQLVLAAERCPVSIIHPGSPLDPKEKDLEKWVKRAEKFN